MMWRSFMGCMGLFLGLKQDKQGVIMLWWVVVYSMYFDVVICCGLEANSA
jgi:hypothetical protein